MGRYPAVDVDVNIEPLISACRHYFDHKDAIAYIAGSNASDSSPLDERNAIYISDLYEDSDFFSILFVRGDPGRELPSFVNTKTRKVKTIKSDEPGDVRGASCHLVISKSEIATGSEQGKYRAAIERVRGVGKALVKDLLSNLMRRYAEDFPHKFTADKKLRSKKDKPETINYRPTIIFNLQENGNLKKDLENGRIGGFKLVHGRTDFQGEASQPKLRKMDIQLNASIVPTSDMGKIRSLITSVQSKLQEIDFEDIKLELVDEGGQVISQTKAVGVDQLDTADWRYCKTLSIPNTNAMIAECHEKLFSHIVEFSIKSVGDEKNWK